MIETIMEYMTYLIRVIMLLSLLLFFVKSKKWALSSPIKLLGLFVLLSILTELTSSLLSYYGYNNLWLLHLYTLLEFLLLSFIYRSLLFEKGSRRDNFTLLLLGISLLVICNSLFLQPINTFNTYAKITTNLCLIFLAIQFLFVAYLGETKLSSIKKTWKVVNAGVLLYFSGSLFVFMFSQYLLDALEWEEWNGIWLYNLFLNCFFQLAILLGLFWYTSEE